MRTARQVIHLWFSTTAPVSRQAYLATGITLFSLKYIVDATAIALIAGQSWSPLDYLSPLFSTRSTALAESPGLLWVLALWTLPFVWTGASMTIRRAIDAGLSGGFGLMFFVPMINYPVMLLLCAIPTADVDDPPSQATPQQAQTSSVLHARKSSVTVSAAFAALVGLVLTIIGVFVFRGYTVSLFLGAPFVIGMIGGYAANRHAKQPIGTSLSTGLLAILFTAGTLLLFGLEGAICLVLALPLALAMSLFGALFGRAVARDSAARSQHIALLLCAMPVMMGADAYTSVPAEREVLSTIEIAAAPEAVWPHVIGFSALPPPHDVVFELGIAYPTRAEIFGEGVGAVRHCEFSTGAFVEPITHWEPPHRLSFDVESQPAPMTELSPYQTVHAPHLLDGFQAQRGEFRLIPLANGGTKLEGRTWYTLSMFPQPYWHLWSDALIHRIHMRVLNHIRDLSTNTPRPTPAPTDDSSVTPV